ncbi:ribosomal RNA small subunit methyltransferase D [Thiosulfatimonas sediminis]|uniref:Ribosomal RNA small subunit methyltransferase D n=1 Tax=Thiosulfatimonas sediminis TaxID=2675054 RepID=A0A6F8PXU2_9GAMM|nr:ribosomal RNA small subunit methyltransferase D [Thiosulfatimonas sediminis]
MRIIGGDFRGRKLPVILADGLRPTSDRVRETLFNWLQFEIAGARCLDAFAGSGALGLEALSRGAREVVFIDALPQVQQQLQQNLQRLQIGVERATVHCTNSLKWVQNPAPQAFDILFLDPPFHKNLMVETLDALFANGWLSEQSLLYLEQEKSLSWPTLPAGWVCLKEKSTPQVRYGLFAKAE